MNRTLHAPVYTLHVEVDDIEPAIWRRLEVPASFTLRRLHDVLQIAMGWRDSHMHLFEIGASRYGFGDSEYDEDELVDADVLLGDVVQRAGDVFEYSYDFGDGWTHTVRVEAIRRDVPRTDVPRVLDGARACPPEDCGGVGGYADLLAVLDDPDDEEFESMIEWLGGRYDADVYDVVAHDRGLDRLRRPAAPAKRRTRRPAAGRTSARARKAAVAERLDDVAGMLEQLRRDVPVLPARTTDIAHGLLSRFAGLQPDEFLSVRKTETWLAASLHAAFMLQPYWLQYPLKPMTLAELSEMVGVSSASISKRSGQLRRGVRLGPVLP